MPFHFPTFLSLFKAKLGMRYSILSLRKGKLIWVKDNSQICRWNSSGLKQKICTPTCTQYRVLLLKRMHIVMVGRVWDLLIIRKVKGIYCYYIIKNQYSMLGLKCFFSCFILCKFCWTCYVNHYSTHVGNKRS